MTIVYIYELRHRDDTIATGRLSREQALEIGDHIDLGTSRGIVREIQPLLGQPELRLVVELLP